MCKEIGKIVEYEVGHMSAQNLIDRIKEICEGRDLTKVSVSLDYTQFQCFGYALYDARDYRCALMLAEEK